MRGPETLNIYELLNCTVWWTYMDKYGQVFYTVWWARLPAPQWLSPLSWQTISEHFIQGGRRMHIDPHSHSSDCHHYHSPPTRSLSSKFITTTTFLQLNHSPRNDNHSHHSPLTTFQAKAREGASHPEQQAWKEEKLMIFIILMMQLMMMRLLMMTFKMRMWFSPFLERAGKQLVEIHMAPLAPWTRQTTAIIVSLAISTIVVNIKDNYQYQR